MTKNYLLCSGAMSSIYLRIAIVVFVAPALLEASMGAGGRWASTPPQLMRSSSKRLSSISVSASATKTPSRLVSIPSDDETLPVPTILDDSVVKYPPRGGQEAPNLVKTVGTVTDVLITCGKIVLPPVAACVRIIAGIYRSLPTDAIIAQAGLVYCFAGGYYPTLFSALQAAQHCGWQAMVRAISDLTNEAIRVIDATSEVKRGKSKTHAELFRQQTGIVLATVDPLKINAAAGSLYTTWLGVSAVLEKEYVRVITLSMTMAGYIERIAKFVIEPPAYFCVEEKYHKWVPVVIGWGCKALAMNVAWRIQRVLTAGTSAMTGGLMFSRASMRMLSKRGVKFFGLIRSSDEESPLDEIIGFLVAGIGFYTQIEAQYRNAFSFRVPFPFSLVTWPFDWAERWIQWQITK